ncbi:hypothetical protein DGMP_22880 [Desulfomarina profundi]|uniref:IS66 family insertion sequence element accessory protein TnpB n=1 Tax=Desulfomarina profundi TaxID=2772557 RepID=A0A8D5JPS9_9BACT|nr:hypothetical protein [Desulfomarina profundi]BCL61595.1 hypothetical protein DGMP_22880 [Desulfomarina profundi]
MRTDQDISTKKTYWRAHIGGWRKSGLSQKKYCQRRNIALATFCYWKRKLETQTQDVRFHPLTVPAPSAAPPTESRATGNLILEYNDFRLEICPGFSPSDLKAVICVLEQTR